MIRLGHILRDEHDSKSTLNIENNIYTYSIGHVVSQKYGYLTVNLIRKALYLKLSLK